MAKPRLRESNPQARRVHIISAAIIIVFAACCYFPVVNSAIYFGGGDNAKYISLARSITEGKGYRDIDTFPETPHVKYPPLFPAMLAAIIVVLGENMLAMKIMISTLAVIAMILWFLCLRTTDETQTALQSAIIAIAFPYSVFYSRRLLTEFPFVCFSFLAIYFFLLFFRKPERGDAYLVAAVISALATYFIRTAGLALVAAIPVAILADGKASYTKKRIIRAAASATAGAAAVAAWTLRNYLSVRHSLTETYVSEFFMKNPYNPAEGKIGAIGLLERMWDNTTDYFNLLGEFLAWPNRDYIKTTIVITVVFICFSIAGFAWRIARKRNIIEWFFMFYLLTILIWPFIEIRFILPLMPIAAFYFIKGLEISLDGTWILLRHERREKSSAVWIWPLTAVIISYSVYTNIDTYRMLRYMSKYPTVHINSHFKITATSQGSAWIMYAGNYVREKTSRDDIIAARKNRLIALLSGRRTVPIPRENDPEKMIEMLNQLEVDYIIFDNIYQDCKVFLAPAMKLHPDKFQMVYRVPDSYTYVIKVLR